MLSPMCGLPQPARVWERRQQRGARPGTRGRRIAGYLLLWIGAGSRAGDTWAAIATIPEYPGVEPSDPVAGPWKIDFVHRTIQEYLTAKEIAEEDHIGALLDVAHLDQWQQVVIMTAGHANTPLRAQLVAGLVDRANRERRHG